MEVSDESSRDSCDLDGSAMKQSVAERRKALKNEEKEKAIKSMKYLLQISEKYSNFCKQKLEKIINQKTNTESTEKLDFISAGAGGIKLKYFENGTLRPYQMEGVTWLAMLYDYGINGILADEMGLGKTVQVIAFIGHLLEKKVTGPFLVVAPLSTIPNWESEFKRFGPKIPCVVLHGNRETRAGIKKKIRAYTKLGGLRVRPVVLITYQGVQLESTFLNEFTWKYIIVDEGHRIKNHNSKLAQELRRIPSLNKMILTGTPLHNNLTELWSLLNFLMPMIFNKIDVFAALFALEDMEDDNKIVKAEESNNVISTIHRVLSPFMLRRLKKDVLKDCVPKKEVLVYCPLSKLQRELYSYTLDIIASVKKNSYNEFVDIDEEEDMPRKKRKCTMTAKSYSFFDYGIDDDFEEKENVNDIGNNSANVTKTKEDVKLTEFRRWEKARSGKLPNEDIIKYLYNIYAQHSWITFKKIVDHPYLIHHPVDENNPGLTIPVGEDLIQESGKLMMLDALLPILKNKGHKVLIFSTMVIMLNLLEDYMILRNYKYCRLDGSHKLEIRQESIDTFNKDENTFVFLISTRAGGLGLNLTSADTVILFDRDWNPQADNQAQDRCHRIGQTKPVVVYTLVTKDTIDEQIIKCANMKKRLEKLVLKEGKFRLKSKIDKKDDILDLEELKKMLESSNGEQVHNEIFSKRALNKLLDRTDLYLEMKAKLKSQ